MGILTQSLLLPVYLRLTQRKCPDTEMMFFSSSWSSLGRALSGTQVLCSQGTAGHNVVPGPAQVPPRPLPGARQPDAGHGPGALPGRALFSPHTHAQPLSPPAVCRLQRDAFWLSPPSVGPFGCVSTSMGRVAVYAENPPGSVDKCEGLKVK